MFNVQKVNNKAEYVVAWAMTNFEYDLYYFGASVEIYSITILFICLFIYQFNNIHQICISGKVPGYISR